MHRNCTGIIATIVLALGSLLAVSSSSAEDVKVQNGHVWEGWYVHVEEVNMESYMAYLKKVYLRQLEALIKANVIVGYKIVTSSPTTPDDWNVAILYEYENMAKFDIPDSEWDRIESKAVEGLPDVKADLDARWAKRRVIGKRVYREVLLK